MPVAQWLRIHLPMQGTPVRALVREDPTCRGATKPVRHNYRACALEPVLSAIKEVNVMGPALEEPSGSPADMDYKPCYDLAPERID
ncbi:hypothetical protein J1605_002851 [Eschrichtius robustus]|uniref:Uncharacterized protein n=1 Tax=Eschrichtius robustus TaxID=9764 RepID=A0AB34HQT4_ESCRO|nr:hypothetical protein J1605_002851 [Eschrichtius robustus]